MTSRVTTVHDRCTGCQRKLHFLAEAERGTCGPCFVASRTPKRKRRRKGVIPGNTALTTFNDVVGVAAAMEAAGCPGNGHGGDGVDMIPDEELGCPALA